MPRVFRFVDIMGSEIHTINDPENQLPIPEIRQVICIGPSKMRVECVVPKRTDAKGSCVYDVRVRLILASDEQLYKN